MNYQKMTEVHVKQVADLEALCFTTAWSENAIRSELTNPLSLWIVAVDGDTVIGYIGSQTVMDESDVMNVAVLPEFRRQGIASALVMRLVAELIKKDVRSLTLEVRESNTDAIALYSGLGFVRVGHRPNYYSKPREAALIFRKELVV